MLTKTGQEIYRNYNLHMSDKTEANLKKLKND
jgi:hypothetical protein